MNNPGYCRRRNVRRPDGSLTMLLAVGLAAAPVLPAWGQSTELGAQTGAAGADPAPMSIVDMIEVPSLSDPRLSPDGSELVYVRRDADWEENRTIGQIWRIGADGSGERQLTTGKEGASSPRWSPDGQWIAFLADREDQEETQVWLLPARGGEARALTDHGTSVSSISWSPDGEWVYFRAEEPLSPE